MSVNKSFLVTMLILISTTWPVSTARPSLPSSHLFEYEGNGRLSLLNTHTNEFMDIKYKDHDGKYIDGGLKNINYMLRCRLTGQVEHMSLKLVELLGHIQDHFRASEIDVISGYRSPELNTVLRSSGHGVAKKSLHMQGMAIDIRIPNVPTKTVRDYAMSLKAGGVGYYSGPDFVHIDVGRVRHW